VGLFNWLYRKLFGTGPLSDEPAPTPASGTQSFIVSAFGTSAPPSPETAAPAASAQPRSQPLPVRAALKAKRPRSINLDAGDFLPISRDELKKGAEQNRGWGSPWWGRRDLIPPADDARTKLIDRGLVTNGFLTPEQLVEIHEVGAEMQRLRPALDAIERQAAQAGAAAVAADRERRAALKEQKKKEAAERRRLRAEKIAQRRATDIVYLGRGVSHRLGERQSDVERLTALGLPILSTPLDLATALGLTIPRLRWLAYHTEVAQRIHYVQFSVPKKSGGMRLLSAPHRQLAAAQQWILEHILRKLAAEPAAHGFVPGRGIVSNAQPHVGKTIIVNLDLENFFPSITLPRVRSVFGRLGYSPAMATILALLCTECPRRQVEFEGKPFWVAIGPRALPQGASTSPALSNQVARRLDKRLGGLAAKLGLTYTRYADDLTFSGDGALEGRIGYLLARVRHLADDEGFVVHQAKNRVQRRNAAQTVTGLVVNDRPTVSRKLIRRLRAILHRAQHEGLEAQNRQNRPRFRA
jgi:RNA-directed DNA polymerase